MAGDSRRSAAFLRDTARGHRPHRHIACKITETMTRDRHPRPPASAAGARALWRYTGEERPPFAIPPGPHEASVWDYPRPPRLVPELRVVTKQVREIEISRTRRALRLLETASPPTAYLPFDAGIAWSYPTAAAPYEARRSYCSVHPGRRGGSRSRGRLTTSASASRRQSITASRTRPPAPSRITTVRFAPPARVTRAVSSAVSQPRASPGRYRLVSVHTRTSHVPGVL